MTLVSEAEIGLADPGALARKLTDHLTEQEIMPETHGATTVATIGRGTGSWIVGADALTVRVEAGSRGDLEMLRSLLATHVVEFAAEPITISWRGHADATPIFDHFREVELVAAAALTPRMRRLTFAGTDLGRFACAEDFHVRLFFPPAGLVTPEWPRPGPDGRTIWPDDDHRPAVRYYTIRRIDVAQGRFEIDFVLHPDGGPGATFAASAVPGARIGMMGPGGRTAGAAASYLLGGDETALPAIARILEGLPRTARGAAFIEIADERERHDLAAPPNFAVTWLRRDGAPAGLPDRLLPALTAAPVDGDSFVWVGCEGAIARTLRQHFRAGGPVARDCQMIAGYWSREAE